MAVEGPTGDVCAAPWRMQTGNHVPSQWRMQAEGYRLIDVTGAVPSDAALEAAP